MRRNFALLWLGQFVSQAGDALLSAVLVFLVLALSPEGVGGGRAGLVRFAATVPFLLLSPLAGMLADRVDRRRLMMASDIARAAVLLAIPFLWQAGQLTWLTLAAAAFLVSTFSSAFSPAMSALVPDIAEGLALLRANALLQTSTQLAMIGGMLVAAAALGAAGAEKAAQPGTMVALIAANGATFLFSAACLFFIRTAPRPPRAAAPAAAGLALALRSPLFRALLFLTAVDNFFIMGPAMVGSAILLKTTFGLGVKELAIFEACLAAGWFSGSIWLARRATFFLPKGKLLLLGMFLDGVTYIPFFWIRSFPLLCFAVFAHGLTIPLITVPRTVLVQEQIPREMQAQAFSLVQLTVIGFTSLSVLATGWLGDRIGAPALFLGAGIGAMVGLAGVFSRALRQAK
ncbi:MAG: multidrug efflux [Planctomycetota bacterium]|nr:MAG: multidrug efflux [Planctomycetota bacterium]